MEDNTTEDITSAEVERDASLGQNNDWAIKQQVNADLQTVKRCVAQSCTHESQVLLASAFRLLGHYNKGFCVFVCVL